MLGHIHSHPELHAACGLQAGHPCKQSFNELQAQITLPSGSIGERGLSVSWATRNAKPFRHPHKTFVYSPCLSHTHAHTLPERLYLFLIKILFFLLGHSSPRGYSTETEPHEDQGRGGWDRRSCSAMASGQ